LWLSIGLVGQRALLKKVSPSVTKRILRQRSMCTIAPPSSLPNY
jgi:hypothetical protein